MLKSRDEARRREPERRQRAEPEIETKAEAEAGLAARRLVYLVDVAEDFLSRRSSWSRDPSSAKRKFLNTRAFSYLAHGLSSDQSGPN